MQNKRTEHNYIEILKDSLDKKISILQDIQKVCDEQERIIKQDKMDLDNFDITIESKDKLIQELNTLDKGFQSVYDRVKEILTENKEAYSSDIIQMQEKIRQITDMSMDIQSREARNKEDFQSKIRLEKKEVRQSKNANKVAANYYHTMNKLNVVDSQFLDTRK